MLDCTLSLSLSRPLSQPWSRTESAWRRRKRTWWTRCSSSMPHWRAGRSSSVTSYATMSSTEKYGSQSSVWLYTGTGMCMHKNILAKRLLFSCCCVCWILVNTPKKAKTVDIWIKHLFSKTGYVNQWELCCFFSSVLHAVCVCMLWVSIFYECVHCTCSNLYSGLNIDDQILHL